MSYINKVKTDAKKLRQYGFSLSEIASKFQVSKSTASLWTSKEKISRQGKIRIRNRQDKARRKAFLTIAKRRKYIAKDISKKAKLTLDMINLSPPLSKLIASIFLWTEGEKGDFGRVSFTNSDPLMISTFLFLLRASFPLDESKFRALVHIHEYHEEKEIIKYWARITKIPQRQFTKSYLKPHTAKRIRNDYMGCVHINYYDYKVARELASVYNMFAKKLRGVG